VPLKVSLNGKKINNVFVDHVNPIVDPEQGFVSWDEFINGLFCERENLQVLCGQCHDEKSLEERKIATERRRQEKEAINEQVI
jgi:5-methylcytosine-specific restriction endonuclease McrA